MKLVRRGRYDEAMSMLEDIDPETLRTLKFHQYWTISFGMIKLQRALHRSSNP